MEEASECIMEVLVYQYTKGSATHHNGLVFGETVLHGFGRVVEEIAEKPASEVTRRILKARPFNIVHREGIIQAVTRNA